MFNYSGDPVFYRGVPTGITDFFIVGSARTVVGRVFPLKSAVGGSDIAVRSYEASFAVSANRRFEVFARNRERFCAQPWLMRISGGQARGISLVVPKGDAVRPATDGMRQSVFSSLGEWVVDAYFLDLFAGSGAYGLEALSRGAAGGVFVENSGKAIQCVRRNIEAVCRSLRRDTTGLMVLAADAVSVPLGAGVVPDVVFIDPPYETIPEIAPELFARLTDVLSSKPGALVIFELPGELELAPPGWTCLKRLGKGPRQPTAAFFRRSMSTD